MANFWERLKQERERLGISQKDFAQSTGVVSQTQVKYEKGVRSPDGQYLEKASKLGVDVQYIVTGVRSPNWPPDTQQETTQIIKEELLDTLEMIQKKTEKGIELVKKIK